MEPLHIHEVHLWCARPETLAAQAAYAAARALLTADERAGGEKDEPVSGEGEAL